MKYRVLAKFNDPRFAYVEGQIVELAAPKQKQKQRIEEWLKLGWIELVEDSKQTRARHGARSKVAAEE